MIDFHSHILPNMDDGANSIEQSLAMLRQSFLQGVDYIVSTSHFYADEEYPNDFLRRRKSAFEQLEEAMFLSPQVYPEVIPGAEVLYFPGISQADEIAGLKIEKTNTILIEPPMSPWMDGMLNEIMLLGENLKCTPVIAHVDRFMRCLRDDTLMDRVKERNMLIQVNAEYFLRPETVKSAIKHLKNGDIALIGSDCHNLDTRSPNLGLARKQAIKHNAKDAFKQLHENAAKLLLLEKGDTQ